MPAVILTSAITKVAEPPPYDPFPTTTPAVNNAADGVKEIYSRTPVLGAVSVVTVKEPAAGNTVCTVTTFALLTKRAITTSAAEIAASVTIVDAVGKEFENVAEL